MLSSNSANLKDAAAESLSVLGSPLVTGIGAISFKQSPGFVERICV